MAPRSIRLKLFLLAFLLTFQPLLSFSAPVPGSLEMGKELLAGKEYAKAISAFEALLEENPPASEASEVLFLMGKAYTYTKKYKEAAEAFEKILAQYPQSPRKSKALYLLAEIYGKLRRPMERAGILKEQAERLSGDTYLAGLSVHYLRVADEAFKGVPVAEPGAFEGERIRKDFKKALHFYRTARSVGVEEGKEPFVSHRIALCLLETGDWKGAAQEWEDLVKKHPQTPLKGEVLFHLGKAFAKGNQLDKARVPLMEMVKKKDVYGDDPWLPWAYQLLGQTYDPLKASDKTNLDQGLKHWRSFQDTYPTHELAPQVLFDIPQALFNFGLYREAAKEWKDFLGRFPSDKNAASAFFKIAECSLRLGDFDGSASHWRTFLEKFPNHSLWPQARENIAESLFQKGETLLKEGREKEAVEAWTQFLDAHPMNPKCPMVEMKLGEIRHNSKDFEGAMALWRAAVTRYAVADPEWAAKAQLAIARTLRRDLGLLKRALEEYQVLIQDFPKTSSAPQAQSELDEMRAKRLELETSRVLTTQEPPSVTLRTRNIPELEFKIYRLDLMDYFLKKGTIYAIEEIDVPIVKPDKVWVHRVKEYEPYLDFQEEVALPLKLLNPEGNGAFIVACREKDFQASTLVIVSDCSLVVKQSPRQVLVFAKNERENRPYEGVRIILQADGRTEEAGSTGPDGILVKEFNKVQGNVKVFSAAGGHYAFGEVMEKKRVVRGYATKLYLFTDRPAYRPGQQVLFKGILRKVSEGFYEPSDNEKAKISVTDPRGNVLYEEEVTTNPFGALSGELTLESACPLGEYILRGTFESHSFERTFRVHEYQKPELLIEVETEKPAYLAGEEVRATAEVKYLFGNPAANMDVQWVLFKAPYTFDYRMYDEYSWFFRDQKKDTDEESAAKESVFVGQGKGRTDAGGKLPIPFKTREEDKDSIYILQVRVLDLSQRWVADQANIFVTQKEFFAILKADKKVYQPKEKIVLSLTTVNASHLPHKAAGDLAIELRRWQRDHYVGQEVRRVAVATSPQGKGEASFSIEKPGDYWIRFVGTDRRGSRVEGLTFLTISGPAEDLAKQAKVAAERQIYRRGETASLLVNSPIENAWALLTFEGEKVLDYQVLKLKNLSNTLTLPIKDTYSPNIFIKVAIPGQNRLFEAEDEILVFKYLNVEISADKKTALPGERVKLTLKATDQNGSPVQAELAVAAVDASLYQLYPDRTPGIKPFFYDQRRENSVTTTSSHIFRYMGKTIPTDPDVLEALSIEREKLLKALANKELDSKVLEKLKSLGYLAVAEGEDLDVERFEEEKEEPVSDKIGLGGGAGRAFGGKPVARKKLAAPGADARKSAEAKDWQDRPATLHKGISSHSATFFLGRGDAAKSPPAYSFPEFVPPPLIRKHFVDTALWEPHVKTDSAGKGEISFSLPDNLTTWQITARGATRDTLVGSGKEKITAKKDLLLRMNTPRFFTQKDRLTLSSLVHNYLEDEIPLKVNLQAEGLALEGAQSLTTQIEPNSTGTFDWTVTAERVGRVSLKAEALTGRESDAVQEERLVLPYGLRTVEGQNGEVTGRVEARFQIPKDIIPGSFKGTLSIIPSLDMSILEGLQFLDHYPYLCVEQTVNRFLPAVAAASAFHQLGLPHERAFKNLDEVVKSGIHRLVNLQNDEGGWGWWGGESHPFLTAYALLSLSHARDAGYSVPDRNMNLAIHAAEVLLDRAGSDQEKRSFLLFALSRVRKAPMEHLNRTYRYRDGLSNYALSVLALAFHQQEMNFQAQQVLQNLKTRAISREGLAFWTARRGAGWTESLRLSRDDSPIEAGSVETTAYAVLALLAVEPQNELIEPAVRWIELQKKGAGWLSTKDTGAAVLALSAFIKARGISAAEYTLQAVLNDHPVATLEVARGKITKGTPTIPLRESLLQEGDNRVLLSIEGMGTPRFVLRVEFYRTREVIEPEGTVLAVKRRYAVYHSPHPEEQDKDIKKGYSILRPEARPKDESLASIGEIAAGDRLTVELSLENREDLEYLIIEDPLPSGCEAVEGSAAGPFGHLERRDEKMTFFITQLSAGEKKITYHLEGVNPGAFHVLPTLAYPMYEPEISGWSAGSRLSILPREESERLRKSREKVTPDEIYSRAMKAFGEGNEAGAAPLFEGLLKEFILLDEYYEEILFRLVSIYLHRGEWRKAVEAYENLMDRNPKKAIFQRRERMLLANAYYSLKEGERASSLFTEILLNSFQTAANVSEAFWNSGRFQEAQEMMRETLAAYPDLGGIVEQAYQYILRFKNMPEEESAPHFWLKKAVEELNNFVALYPEHPLADDATFEAIRILCQAFEPEQVLLASRDFPKRYPQSLLLDSVLFYRLQAFFSLEKYKEALEVGGLLTEKKFRVEEKGEVSWAYSKNRERTFHLMAKIHHILGDYRSAVSFYEKVKDRFNDARDALDFFTQKALSLKEVQIVPLLEKPVLPARFKNLTEVEIKIYPVDFQILFAARKSLQDIHRIDLTGIAPLREFSYPVQDSREYGWNEREIPLPLLDKGVYLVVVRKEGLDASSIVILSDLKIRVQKVENAYRIHAFLGPEEFPVKNALVRASDGKHIVAKGVTDARGIFEVENLKGNASVVVEFNGHFAFWQEQ